MGRKAGKQIDRWGTEGVTVTFRHRETGEPNTVYEPGKSRLEALRRACARFDYEQWRADVVSTPQSIYDDLTHARKLTYPSDVVRGRSGMVIQHSAGGVITGETPLLVRAGCRAWL